MMKIQSVISVFLLTINLTNGQATFHKTYGNYGIDGANCVRQTSDGGYIAAGGGYCGNILSGNYVIKTDANGDTSWTKIISGNYSEYASHIEQTANGGYIICGTSSYSINGPWDISLTKTDANGNVIWNNRYDITGMDYGTAVCQTYDGGYILTGYGTFSGNNFDMYVCKTDTNGIIEWSKIMGGSGDDICSGVVQSADSGYVITGSTFSFGRKGSFLSKLDQSGNLLWMKTYEENTSISGCASLPAFQQTPDGGYIIVAQSDSMGFPYTWLIKTDAAGVLLWNRKYSPAYPRGICVTSDGGYAIAITHLNTSAQVYDLCVLKTDSLGNVSWCKLYGDSTDEYIRDIRQTSDGGFILGGSKFYPGLYDYDLYLVKTDPNGNSGCYENNFSPRMYSPVGIETSVNPFDTSVCTMTAYSPIFESGVMVNDLCSSTGIAEIKNEHSMLLYPNPSTGNFTVNAVFSKPHAEAVIEVINSLGQTVYREQLQITGGASKKEFTYNDLKLSDGLYFVHVYSAQETFTGTLMVLLHPR